MRGTSKNFWRYMKNTPVTNNMNYEDYQIVSYLFNYYFLLGAH